MNLRLQYILNIRGLSGLKRYKPIGPLYNYILILIRPLKLEHVSQECPTCEEEIEIDDHLKLW